ncbi:predicted nucleic-acid-binding protein implicated in transcription termination [Lentilactobacillus farraginis DSM 18382 = JCM 14108]|uniref:Predicted nucleic-acid-binding protein implicated in transcription termination n=1 Tax=Lentilactobacillus farraginis DSM 18382 = JCM 14108 TaxID=1423743 RepID=X0PEM3_9LACO|nr:predicted nucleic-acid-binding protein implicated in transcription termination [Lentilactobacillus farraginis DSM 18382 = JCM 14108]
MKKRKIPMRKDIVTGEMAPKKELIRIVRDAEGQVSIDETGKKSGRGAISPLMWRSPKKPKQNMFLKRSFQRN